MTIKSELGIWILSTETRSGLKGDKLVTVNVTIAWNEEKGYVREFYGDALIDLT